MLEYRSINCVGKEAAQSMNNIGMQHIGVFFEFNLSHLISPFLRRSGFLILRMIFQQNGGLNECAEEKSHGSRFQISPASK